MDEELSPESAPKKQSNKLKTLTIIVSCVLSLAIVAGALVYAQTRQQSADAVSQKAPPRDVGKAELTKADGKQGRKCYVAVDGTVYEIKDFSLWENGKHKTSGGRAYCGADMTQAINQSPHGRKVLDLLIEIGPYKA